MKSQSIFFIFILNASLGFAQKNARPGDEMLLEYYQTQRFADAADYLKRTYPEPVNDSKALSSLAYSSQMAGRLGEAESYYQRILEKDSTNTAVLYNLGGINLRRGNSPRALIFFKKILNRDSTNVSVYKQLAILSKNTGDIPASINYLQKANKLDPKDPDVAFNLVQIYAGLNFFNQAAKILEPALTADTANLLLLQAKAQVNFMLKNYTETTIICTKLIAQGQRTNSIISWLGESWFMLRQYQHCINTFLILDTLKMANETSCYYIGMSYKALNDQQRAVTYLLEAIKQGISPNIDSYYSEIGDSYERIHLYKKSATAYQKSLEFDEKALTY
jgi:tetratricopeptide (TPR) repeat protein